MITLEKKQDKDFIILNITDPQLSNEEWAKGHKMRQILTHTVEELVARVKPDLITISGDLAWAGHHDSYKHLANLMDSFGVPWSPVWGNHDQQNGMEEVQYVVDMYRSSPYFSYEEGDSELGNGNYVIAIEEEGRIVLGLIMMDTHDRFPLEDGKECWGKVYPEQVDWYRKQVQLLKEKGCDETALITHIPIYAYRKAYDDAQSKEFVGFRGAQNEGICSCDIDDGMLDAILEMGTTKTILAGHDHVNNWMYSYCGVNFMYALKTGAGCYWDPSLNGGTVFRVTSSGISDVYHEFVTVSDIVE